MRKCLLLINKISGNAYRALNNPTIYSSLQRDYDIIDTLYIDRNTPINIKEASKGYAGLAVCGGDGTFNNAINATRGLNLELIYIPCGTLNDAAKTLHLTAKLRTDERIIRRVDIGEINDTLFSYVAATGSFTAIGYKTNNKLKKRIKFFAYLWEVLREYSVHHIKAKIELGDRVLEDTYTLIMGINSQRCFGFNFNKLYQHNSGKAHLLLIKAPKGKRFFSKMKMFFPFFRAFFIGFKKEYTSKNIVFTEFEDAKINIDSPTTFTIDGEKIEVSGSFNLKIHKQKMRLFVY